MRILQVASEAFGLCKTGGLADVTTGLSRALQQLDADVRLLLPAYPGLTDLADARPLIDMGDPLGTGPTEVLSGRLPGTDVVVWLVRCPTLFDRPGGPYLDPSGRDHPDNHRRFGLLCRVAALLCVWGPLRGWTPDVVHCHDWQAGLVPAYLAQWGGRRPSTLFTIHNLAFSGRFDPAEIAGLGLPPTVYSMYGLEFHGTASFLKAGLFYADALSTVSPTYAAEIRTPLGGEGFHGLLDARAPDLHGIVNGIDDEVWNPATDPALPAHYDVDRDSPTEPWTTKRRLKAKLQAEVGLHVDADAPLFGMVSRLTWQKGVDLLLDSLPTLLDGGAQLLVLGSGEAPLEAALREAMRRHPGRVAFVHGYHEPLSHRVIAGVDSLCVPSRFEPCGLTQMYAMRYGTPPLVRRTGGLADTVIDAIDDELGTGITFFEPTALAMRGAVARAIELMRTQPERWRALARTGMRRSFGWREPAQRYLELYRELADEPPTAIPLRRRAAG